VLAPIVGRADILSNGREVALECLGDKPGRRYLGGRTQDATVGLVDRIRIKTYSGAKWRVYRNQDGTVGLLCRGVLDGPRWLACFIVSRVHRLAMSLSPFARYIQSAAQPARAPRGSSPLHGSLAGTKRGEPRSLPFAETTAS
jgi:hypothetical protein